MEDTDSRVETAHATPEQEPSETRVYAVSGTEFSMYARHLSQFAPGAPKISVNAQGRVFLDKQYIFTFISIPHTGAQKTERLFRVMINFFPSQKDDSIMNATIHLPKYKIEQKYGPHAISDEDFEVAAQFLRRVAQFAAREQTMEELTDDPLTVFTRVPFMRFRRALQENMQARKHNATFDESGDFSFQGRKLFTMLLGPDGCFQAYRNPLFGNAIGFPCKNYRYPNDPSAEAVEINFCQAFRPALLKILDEILDSAVN